MKASARFICFICLMILCIFASCSNNTPFNGHDNLLYRIRVGDNYGFMDERGKIVIEPQFDDAYTHFTEGVCYAETGDRIGLIDRSGGFIVEFPDSVLYVSNFIRGFARVNCGSNKRGIINREGKIVVSASNYEAKVNEDGENLYFCLEGAMDDNDWFMTNKDGAIIGEPCDSILYGFRNGLCPIKKGTKWGYMDTEGKMIIDFSFDYAKTFSENGLARVIKDGEHMYINKTGEIVLSVEKALSGFTCNRAAVVIEGKTFLIDNKGARICELDADDIRAFRESDKMATIFNNGVASLIDTTGAIVLSTNYESIGAFIDGVAPVSKNGRVGYIDLTGKEVIPITHEQYITATHVADSRIRALQSRENGIWVRYYYDLLGNLIWKDSPSKSASFPYNHNKQDFIEYFDARLAELDPIEGIYYVTNKDYYQNRDNPSIVGLNGTHSKFYAVVRDDSEDGYICLYVGESGIGWVNKFVKIGDTNSYAVMKIDKDNNYSSDGRITIEDFNQFDFTLDRGHNDWYYFFVTYEFVRDYPPLSEIEKVMKVEWTGSGFAIADGYIATNYHVTSGAKSIRVKGVGGDMTESYSGYVVASDKDHDISIIKIVDKDFDSLGTIPYSIGKSTVEMGDDVFVLGYPMTSTMGEGVKLTEGIISSTSGFKGDDSMYQISAAVQPGNSGGPLFNSDGSVIGIVCGKHAEAENANYAIKVSYLYSLVNKDELGIKLADNSVNNKKLSKKVKKIKDFVYLIECSSK